MTMQTMPSFLAQDDFKTKSGIFVSKNQFIKYPIHQHEYYEIEYITNGNGIQFINGEKTEIKAGDVSFITPSDFHGYVFDSVFNTITIHFSEESVGSEYRELIDEAEVGLINNAPLSLVKELNNIFDIYNTDNSWTSLRLTNCLERILIEFFSNENRSYKENKVVDKITEAIGYVNKNYRDSISVKGLSEMLFISPEYFSKMFKQRTGRSFVKYVTDKRLEYAKKLLRGGASVTDASYASGFGSERNFSRQFAKRFGKSPSDYKKTHKMS